MRRHQLILIAKADNSHRSRPCSFSLRRATGHVRFGPKAHALAHVRYGSNQTLFIYDFSSHQLKKFSVTLAPTVRTSFHSSSELAGRPRMFKTIHEPTASDATNRRLWPERESKALSKKDLQSSKPRRA